MGAAAEAVAGTSPTSAAALLMLWRRPLWPSIVVALVAVFFLPTPVVEWGIFLIAAVSGVLVVMQIVRAFQRVWPERRGSYRAPRAPSGHGGLPPHFVGEPVSMLYPDNGADPIIDPTSSPGWADAAADQGANVQADWDGPNATGIRYTASAWYPLNVMRVNLRPAPPPPPWERPPWERPGAPLPPPRARRPGPPQPPKW